jgi:hypothetical protein
MKRSDKINIFKERERERFEFKISLTIKYTRREIYHTETKLVIKTDSQFIPTNSELITNRRWR